MSSPLRALLLTLLLLGHTAAEAKSVTLSLDQYRDRVLGGWAGQMIGVSYGSVYEFNSQGAIYEGPIRDWQPSFVSNALGQDDLYVEMTFLKALQDFGLGITDQQAGKAFSDSRYGLAHANYYGRENCRRGIMPPKSGSPQYNQHADDIDFQIESDVFGLITPGMPRAVARLCDRFGHIMNYGDGVYGGMFIAGMYSAAFFQRDVGRVLSAGLACIPPQSKYARLISDVVAFHRRNPRDWRMLQDKWAQDHLCPDGRGTPFNIDAKLNGGYVAIALLYGGGDWGKTLEIAVRCGQDSDCNPSSAAGVLGATTGYRGIPERYRAGIPAIGDKQFAFVPYSFNTLADACAAVARKVVEAEGGQVRAGPKGEMWRIEVTAPKPPAKVEQWACADRDLRAAATPGIQGKRGVRLRWRAVEGALGYRVFRADSSDGVPKAVSKVLTSTSFEDAGLAPGQVAYYQVGVSLQGAGWARTSSVRSYVLAAGPLNEPSEANLARQPWALADAAVLAPTGSGLRDIGVIRDGVVSDQSYDSFDGMNRAEQDWYAILFTRPARANAVEYVEAKSFNNGGWWLSLRVQYLDPVTLVWRDCPGAAMAPGYDFGDHQEGRAPYSRWRFILAPVTCAGVRVVGRPGGSAAFTSIAELEVYCR